MGDKGLETAIFCSSEKEMGQEGKNTNREEEEDKDWLVEKGESWRRLRRFGNGSTGDSSQLVVVWLGDGRGGLREQFGSDTARGWAPCWLV